MKGFIAFTIIRYGEATPITAYYSQIYKMNGDFYWQGFPITTHPAEIRKDIEEEINRMAKPYAHQV